MTNSNVTPLHTPSANLRCIQCFSEWFDLVVALDARSHAVTGQMLIARCHECGTEHPISPAPRG